MKHLNWGGGVGGGQEAAADALTDRGSQQLRRTEVWHSSPRCLLLLTAGAEQHGAERKEKRKAYLLHRAFSLSTALRHRLSFLKRKSRPPHQKHPCWFFFTAGEKPPSLTERVSGCSNLQNVPQITSVPVPLSVSYSRQLLFWVLPSRLPSSHSSSSSSSVLSSRSLSLFFLYEPRCCYRACTRAFTYTVGWALYSSDAGGWRWETAVNQQRLFSRQDLSNKSSFC